MYNYIYIDNKYRSWFQHKLKKNRIKYNLLFCFLLSPFILNFGYQIIKKPAEIINFSYSIFFETHHPVDKTWTKYEQYFNKYSIGFMTPEFLCALAQVESSGNPTATPRWILKPSFDLRRIYAPASSSVGLLQYINSIFKESRLYRIRDHKVVMAPYGKGNRLSPSNSIEITSARLFSLVIKIINKFDLHDVTNEEKQRLASVIHLCGYSMGIAYAESEFNYSAIKKCGAEAPNNYFNKVVFYMEIILDFERLNKV